MYNGTISEIKNCETHFMGFAIFLIEDIKLKIIHKEWNEGEEIHSENTLA